MLPKRNTRLSSGTPRGTGTAHPMTDTTTPKTATKTPKTATKTPRTSNVRQVETVGTPRKITVEFLENQTEEERENLSLAIASAMTDICTADTEKKAALNGLTKTTARAFINAGSKLDPAVVSYVEKLASKRGLSEMLSLSDGDLKKNETYCVWENAYSLGRDDSNAENYRFFEVFRFLTKNSKRHRNRVAATFPPTKGHDCTMKQISDFAFTLLLVLRDAAFIAQPACLALGSGSGTSTTVETEEDKHDSTASKCDSEDDCNEEEYDEYTREDLLCRVAKFVMFGGILVADKENFQSSARNSGRRWPRFYKYIFDTCRIVLPESVASTSFDGRNAERKEDPFDLKFKEEVISHIFMIFFRGNDCATPYVKRIYGFFKKVHELKNAPRNMHSAKRVGTTLFDLRDHFLDQILLWGTDEDETLLSSDTMGVVLSENHARTAVGNGTIDTSMSSSPCRLNHHSLMYETPKRPHRGTHSKDKLLAALESLAGDPTNTTKYSEVVVFAHESYPQLNLLLGYYCSDPLSPAAKKAFEEYCRGDGKLEQPISCSEEREFVDQLRNLKKGNHELGDLTFLRSLLPLFKSSDKFYGDTECDTLEQLFTKSYQQLISEPRPAMSKGRDCNSSLGNNGSIVDDMEIKAPAISFSPTDTSSLGQGVVENDTHPSLPIAPTYTTAGILGNLEAFNFARPSKDACRVEHKDGKLVNEPVFAEEVKHILARKHQVPLNENELALAGYRMNQCHMRIIRFVDHGAMGFVFLAKHLPSGKLVALKFGWFHSWDVGDYLIRVLVNHSAVNDDSHVMTLYDWWVVTHDGQHNIKPTPQGRSTHNSTAVKKLIRVDGDEDEHMLICIASEWCPGGTFKAAVKNRVNRGTLTVTWILEHAHRLSQALVRFSKARIVHRDLKPGNILFGDDGIPKIADFGLVRKPTGSQEMGTKGAGTPGFRNVAGMLHGTYDSATDVTGLGYTLRDVFLDLATEESTKEKTEVATEETVKQEAFTTQRMEETVVDGYRHRETLKKLHRIILHAIVEYDEDRISVQDLELELGVLHKSVSDGGA